MVNNTPVLLMNRLSFKSRNRNEVVRTFNGAAYESGVKWDCFYYSISRCK